MGRGQRFACTSAAAAALQTLERTRPFYAAMVKAEVLVTQGRADAAAHLLTDVLHTAPPGFALWTVPIEPAFHEAIRLPVFARFLTDLATRAD